MQIERLERLLAEARDALLNGDYRALDEIAQACDTALAAPGLAPGLPPGLADQPSARRLIDTAKHIATMVAAARAGIADSMRRSRAAETAETYDSQGRRARIAPGIQSGLRRL